MDLKFFNLSCRRQCLFDGAQRYLSLFVLNAKMTFSDKDLTFLLMSLSRLPMASLPHHDHFDITATPHRCIIYFPFCLSLRRNQIYHFHPAMDRSCSHAHSQKQTKGEESNAHHTTVPTNKVSHLLQGASLKAETS